VCNLVCFPHLVQNYPLTHLGMDPVEHDSEEYREKMGETMSSDEYSLNALVARLNSELTIALPK
jgi:hypothetical protein